MTFEHGDRRDGQRCCDLQPRPQPDYRINLTIAVVDPQALWTAAAAKLLAAPGITVDDMVDMIGPCEDPSIADCLATLAEPVALPGCILDDFWVADLSRARHRTEAPDGAIEYKMGSVERGRRPSPSRRVAPLSTRSVLPPTQDVAQPN